MNPLLLLVLAGGALALLAKKKPATPATTPTPAQVEQTCIYQAALTLATAMAAGKLGDADSEWFEDWAYDHCVSAGIPAQSQTCVATLANALYLDWVRTPRTPEATQDMQRILTELEKAGYNEEATCIRQTLGYAPPIGVETIQDSCLYQGAYEFGTNLLMYIKHGTIEVGEALKWARNRGLSEIVACIEEVFDEATLNMIGPVSDHCRDLYANALYLEWARMTDPETIRKVAAVMGSGSTFGYPHIETCILKSHGLIS